MSQTTNQAATAVVETCDPVWTSIRREAEEAIAREAALGGFIYSTVLNHASLEEAISYRLAQRLDQPDIPSAALQKIFGEVLERDAVNCATLRSDLAAVYDRDPACTRYLEPLLYFKGYHALLTHRFAHALWCDGRKDLAFYLQSRSSSVFGVDINPACRIGNGIMLDHGSGIVIGETATIGDDCSILQGVTLGGNGKESGDRHPKVGHNVLIGAGAIVLGNIQVGNCSLIAAGSVVLKPVPAHKTVAGVPAKVVGPASCTDPARSMDQRLTQDDCGSNK